MLKSKISILIIILIISNMFASCQLKNKEKKEQIPTTIIQVQMPGNEGITKITFDYEVGFEPIVEFHGEAYPVHIVSLAAINKMHDGSDRMLNSDDYIGDMFGDFGATILVKGSSDETVPLRFEVEGNRFINKSYIDIDIVQGKEMEVFPRISYDYHALERLTQPASENVYFRLFYNSIQIMEKMKVVRFHSVNEIPFRFIDRRDNEEIIDYSFLFTAYVNEDDPAIDRILQEALQIGVTDKIGYGDGFSFSGYQSQGTRTVGLTVDLQALAIWSVFLKNNIKYSNITTTSNVNNNVASQYVRTLGESFGNTQANCVDGSVLFASVLRKIGIEPILVLVPGHMYLCYVRNPEMWEYLREAIYSTKNEEGDDVDLEYFLGENWYSDDEVLDMFTNTLGFIETTMLGNVNISSYTKDESWWGKIKNKTGLGKTQSSMTLDSFLAAMEAGEEQFKESIINILDKNNNEYQLIEVSIWRLFGIRPVTRF